MLGVAAGADEGLFRSVPEDDIPKDAQRLIAVLDSVEQLEVLLLLARPPLRTWSPETVAEELRTGAGSVAKRLQSLAAAGWVATEPDGAYAYRPADTSRERAVATVASLYASRPYTVIDLIFAKPIKNLRVYADAFRFNKEEPNG